MDRLNRLLIIVFCESLSTVLLERGLYFYVEEVMQYRDVPRLALALGFGVLYVLGALLSHPLALRYKEKPVLVGSIALQALGHLALAVWTTSFVLVPVFLLLGLCYGVKWPIIESYVSAGRNARDTSVAVGRFSVGWSSAVPVALVITGPLIAWWPPAMFLVAVLLNLLALGLLRPFEQTPPHWPDDHPERLSAGELSGYGNLLVSSRWTLFASYALLFVLAPLMPTILGRLGWGVQAQTGLSGVMDVLRVAAFIVLQWAVFWHGRRDVVAACILALPLSFFLIVFGPTTGAVLTGEVVFGFAAGAIYYAALYYGMLVRNASVDAGGAHESMIGLGFALGPLSGLLGLGLAGPLGSRTAGLTAGVTPLIVVCVLAGLWTLYRRRGEITPGRAA